MTRRGTGGRGGSLNNGDPRSEEKESTQIICGKNTLGKNTLSGFESLPHTFGSPGQAVDPYNSLNLKVSPGSIPRDAPLLRPQR